MINHQNKNKTKNIHCHKIQRNVYIKIYWTFSKRAEICQFYLFLDILKCDLFIIAGTRFSYIQYIRSNIRHIYVYIQFATACSGAAAQACVCKRDSCGLDSHLWEFPSSNEAKRNVVFRHSTRNIARIRWKMVNENVLMGTKCLNTSS